ncbi:MAG: hypothetical protein FWD56_03435 [Bacteroidales bacterium]|nr:hypothetical protein [Bacteroidales bacterium]
MNHFFSFYRIKQLAIRYLAERGRRDLIIIAAYFIAFAFLPRLGGGNPSDASTSSLFTLILILGGMRFTARIFHEIHQPASGMHFLHIPASRLEKFLLNGVLTLLFYPVVCLLLYYGGTLFGNLIAPVVPSFLNYPVIDVSSIIPAAYLKKMIPQYLICQATFFAGSLFFKKHPTTKTLILFTSFFLAVGVIQLIVIKFLWGDIDPMQNGAIVINSIDLFQAIESSSLLTGIKYISIAFVTAFFWFVAYFKFKEKQV